MCLLDIRSTTTPQWGKLPPELVHDIFRYAARLSTEFSLTLCRVSSWTRRLALPHLYTTVILKNNHMNYSYVQFLKEPPFVPPVYNFEPKTALRNLWMETDSDLIVSIFNECDNIVHLALHAYNVSCLVQESSNADCRLSHDAFTRKGDLHLLILKPGGWHLPQYIDPNETAPLSSKVTHLQLSDSILYHQLGFSLTHLTRLTHICVPFWLPVHRLSGFNHVLDHPSMKVLVVTVYMDLVHDDDLLRVRNWFREKRSTDGRVYLIESRSDKIWQQEWEQEVGGGESIWSRALRSVGTLEKEE